MIDDILGVSKCSDGSIELNSIINVKVESKKLRLSQSKCFKLHISKSSKVCPVKLKAHQEEISQAKKAPYLGDVLNEEGTLGDTIVDRKNKSIGRINQISSILSSISLGFYYVDIALVLRESMLINGIITNAEVWYNVNEEHYKILEAADKDLFRNIFNAHSKTASELFYLETGKIPIRFVISKRRFGYLWQILTRSDEELIKKIYQTQSLIVTKGDWYQMIQNLKQKFGISSSDEEISKMSKNKFKSLVEKKVNEFAFKYLKDIAARHSKSLKILEESSRLKTLKKKNYLQENNFSKVDTQLLFELRTRMLDVKTNFGEM